VTEEWSGFRFNTHAKLMLMMDVMPPYADLALESWGCRYVQPEVAASLLTRDGRALTFYSDIDKTAASIARFSPDDAERYRDVMADWYTIVNEALIPATYPLPIPMLDMVVSYQQSEIGEMVNEMAEETFLETLDAAGFENDLLNAGLLHLGTMYGIDPEGGLGFLLPLLATRLLHSSVIVSGSHQLAASLARSANSNGARLERAAEVVKILTDGARAVGVRLASGEERRARSLPTIERDCAGRPVEHVRFESRPVGRLRRVARILRPPPRRAPRRASVPSARAGSRGSRLRWARGAGG